MRRKCGSGSCVAEPAGSASPSPSAEGVGGCQLRNFCGNMRIQALQRLSPHFFSQKEMRMPGFSPKAHPMGVSPQGDLLETSCPLGFEPGPLTFVRTVFHIFPWTLFRASGTGARKKGPWKAKILARLYYIRNCVAEYSAASRITSARIWFRELGFKKLGSSAYFRPSFFSNGR